jgi:Ca2+-binding RTX toxin-like protein
MPTAGNDTITGGALISDIDGDAGDDVLVLRYDGSTLIDGYRIALVDISLASWRPLSHVWLATEPGPYPPYLIHDFAITGVERLNIIGAQHAPNWIGGGDGNDTIQGGSQADILGGGGGSDLIIAGMGNDTISVAPAVGRDQLYGGAGDDRFMGAQLQDTVYGGDGHDRLEFVLTGSPAINMTLDELRNSANWNGIEEIGGYLTFGDDTLFATDITMRVHGSLGNDLLIVDRTGLAALEANFQADLALGFERLTYYGSSFDDRIAGTVGNDSLHGAQGNDTFNPGAGRDILIGGNGDDWFMGVDENDTIVGGAGIDRVSVNLQRLTQGVVVGAGYDVANITGVEIFNGVLTRYNDTVYGGALSGSISGWQGVDTIVLDYSVDPMFTSSSMRLDTPGPGSILLWINTYGYFPRVEVSGFEIYDITGTSGADDISTASGSDTIRGGTGNDKIQPGPGNDLVFGGEGNDQLGLDSASTSGSVNTGRDTLYGGAGDDYMVGGPEDRIDGGEGFDTLRFDLSARAAPIALDLRPGGIANWTGFEAFGGTLTTYDDTLFVGAISGDVDAGAGQDRLVLNASIAAVVVAMTMDNQVFHFTMSSGVTLQLLMTGFERNEITGSSGHDSISATDRDDLIFGGAGDDTILGQVGIDSLHGGAGNDWISGGDGADTLYGGTGVDWIEGGAGHDVLFGGQDADLFVFAGSVASGLDVIRDFSVLEDALYVSGSVRRNEIRVTTVGDDLRVIWANGEIVLVGLAGQSGAVDIRVDSDFV